MSEPKQRSNQPFGLGKCIVLAVVLCVTAGLPTEGEAKEEMASFERRDTSFYSTFYQKQLYNPTVGLLDPLRLYRKLTFSSPPALDVNRYDEVLNSKLFTNRQGKQPLTIEELVNAPLPIQDPGPSMEGPWTILKGKTDGVTPGFFIKDVKGDRFLLKFDPRSNPEMTTGAEIISHKFFYAFGYNVPSYSLVEFTPDILEVDPGATYYTTDGFKVPLTREKAIDMLKRDAPMFRGGKYRASASRILEGQLVGFFDLDEKNQAGPEAELIPPNRLRTIRGLQVFGAWTNNYDLHRKNTMEVVETENGKLVTKRYLLDFGSSFGSAAYRPKVPAVGFETMLDADEIIKATGGLKAWEKPWEKRWDENKHVITHPNLGYFDNRFFDPGKWKSNLPHFAFTYLTPGDGYWAAKIISNFSDEDIEAVVKTGRFSLPSAEKLLTDILIERRDMLVRYWFYQVSPLENFRVENGNLTFDDLGVLKASIKDRAYRYTFYQLDGKRKKKLSSGDTRQASLPLPQSSGTLLVEIEAVTEGDAHRPVRVELEASAPYSILSIEH